MSADIDFQAVKGVQQSMWADGDFSAVATGLVIVGELLCEAVDVMPGQRVLDVACGSGTATLAAARRGAAATGVDYVPALLERGRERAAAERLHVEWVEGDAEALPVEDGSFDVVLSTFGSMFAPDHPRAAQELLRACRPGGVIGLANWTPEGLWGQLFATVARHAPPPAPIDAPILWGSEQHLRRLFGDGVSSLQATPRDLTVRAPSIEHWIGFFRTNFGPIKTAFERVGARGEQALADDLRAVLGRFNRGEGGVFAAPAQYLEVVARRS